ncbi:unnamed protein product, partial [Ixodes persulcatus]
MTELLVSKECDTHGVFSEPAYAVVVAGRRLNERDLSALGLGEGYSLFLLPVGHTTVPACTESRPLLNQPEVVLPSEPERRDTLVDCKLGDVPGVPHQCPLCASKMTRQLQEDICTASTALVVKRNVEHISAGLEMPPDMPTLRLSKTLISRKYNQIDIQIQKRPLPSSMLNETGQAKCTKGSLTILDDVTPGGINTEANRINFELSQGCSCDFLGQGTGYAVLLSDKSLSDIGRAVQLDNTFKLVSLDKGLTNLSACSDHDVMMSDGHAASYGEEDVGCSAPPTTCPRCHNTLVPELYPLICDAPTLVRVLSMNPAHRDDTGTFCGKARVIQAHRGNVDDYAKTISYSLLDSCNCDYVTKPSRQYYAFISGPRPSQGLTLKHLVMTDQVHMVAYSYRNARLLDDALKICQTPKAEKRNDGFGYVGDQAYQQSQGHSAGYGGASSPVYGSGSHGASGGASYPSGHSQPKPAGYSHVKSPGGYGATYDQSSATAQPSAYGPGATYAPARAPSYGATYAPAHASSYGATPASAYGSQNAPYGHAQPSGYDASYKAAASPVSYGSPPGYGSAYAPGHSSGHAASYTSAPAYSYSSGAPLGYGASSGYGTVSAPSYGSSATPSYAAATTSSYGSAAPAPSYGHPDSSGYESGYTSSHGSAGPAYAAAPSPGYSSAGAAYAVTSAPGYGSSGPAYGPAPAHGYNSAGAAHAPAPSSKQGYAGATYNSAHAPGYASSGVAYAAAPGPAYGASGPVYAAGAARGHGAAPSSYAGAPARNYGHGGSASGYGGGYGTAPSYGPSPSSNYPASGSYNNNADKYPSQPQAYGGGPGGGYRAQGNYAQNGGGYASSGASYGASYATDTTYAPSYGMSDYESLYPSEEDYAPVISYMPTYAPLDEYSAQTAASATYAAPSYNAGYGATYHQPGASGSYAPPVYAPQSYPSGNAPQVHVTYSVSYSPGSASHGPPAYAAPGYKNPMAAAGYSAPASYVPSMGHYGGAAAPSSASYNSPSRDYNNAAASSGGYSQVQHSSSGASYAPAAYQPHARGYGTGTVPSSAYYAPAPYSGSGAGYKAGAAPVAAHYAPAFRGSSAGNYGAGAAPSSAFYGSSAGSYG